jgi:hypothetical protein
MFILVRDAFTRQLKTQANYSKAKIADLVQISPEDFKKESTVAIEDNLNAKYSNKVPHSQQGAELHGYHLQFVVGHSAGWPMYLPLRPSLGL